MLDTIGDRIKVLKGVLNIKTNAELERGILLDGPLLTNGVIASWVDRPVTFTSTKLERFLNHYRINKEWWLTGQGEVIDPGPVKMNDKEFLLHTYQHTVNGLRADIAFLKSELNRVTKERDDLQRQLDKTASTNDV